MSEDDIEESELRLEQDYGFVQSEIRFIMKHKPSLVLEQDDPAMPSAKGLKVLQEFFCEKHDFDMDLVRGLIIKYPFILSKT